MHQELEPEVRLGGEARKDRGTCERQLRRREEGEEEGVRKVEGRSPAAEEGNSVWEAERGVSEAEGREERALGVEACRADQEGELAERTWDR